MITREQIVAEALTWEGTPFHHTGRIKGAGVDCVGVVLGVARNVGIEVWDVKRYSRLPSNGVFEQAVDSQTVLIDLADVLPGDLMKFRWASEPQHLAMIISVNPIRIIHAFALVNRCVISEFDSLWQARFAGARRFKELG